MKITVESTAEVGVMEVSGARQYCRKWIGATDAGVPVHAYVISVSAQTRDEAKLAVFERELGELQPAPKAFDLRFIL